MNDLVSIIVPIYNMKEHIANGLKSIIDQTYSNIEVLIIDDGSTDGSSKLCDAAMEEYDKVTTFHQKNSGAGIARNNGIKYSKGKYIYFMDIDDTLHKDAIKIAVENIEKTDCDIIVFGYEDNDVNGNTLRINKWNAFEVSGDYIRKNYHEFFLTNYAMGMPWNKLFKSDIIKKYNITFPNLRRMQDDIFTFRFIDKVNNAKFITDVLYSYTRDDLAKMWKKCFDNYILISNAIYDERLIFLHKWNSKNKKAFLINDRFYIGCICTSLELPFRKKYTFKKTRLIFDRIYNQSKKLDIPITEIKDLSHRITYLLFKHKLFCGLYLLMKLKIFVKEHTNYTYG